ncbi:MAG: hypothetical protein DDT20_00773 [Firmicutes bacterium]|nr:hypothetical protein [Bacillota bacterium]
MSDTVTNTMQKLLENKKVQLLLALALVLVALRLYSPPVPQRDTTLVHAQRESSLLTESSLSSLLEYQRSLEAQLVTHLSHIAGAGQVAVMITFAASGQTEFATNREETRRSMYSLWPPQPVSRLGPINGTIPVSGVPAIGESEYFAEHRLERDRERSLRIELLKGMMNNPNLDAAARGKAQVEIMNASTRREQEKQIERLIIGQGFVDAVVVFGEGNAVAVVRADSMTETEALTIAETVCNISGLRLQNVRVRFRK